MGLIWTEYVPARNWAGTDTRGRLWAMARGVPGGGWDVCVNEWGCGVPRGAWLGAMHGGPWSTVAEAHEAADRHVVAHVDAVESGAVTLPPGVRRYPPRARQRRPDGARAPAGPIRGQ